MSKGTPPNGSHGDALAALHGLGDNEKPAPKNTEPLELDGEAETDTSSSASASGFVGMLAKGNPVSDEPTPTRPNAPSATGNRPTPQPQSSDNPSEKSPRMARTDEIRMAKEVTLPASNAPSSYPARSGARPASRGPRKIPGWYHAAVPMMYTLCSFLTLISFWAIGAVVYIYGVNPNPQERPDIRYPLLMFSENGGGTDIPGYAFGSKIIALIMLAAFPVALALCAMAIVMQRQITRSEAASQKS